MLKKAERRIRILLVGHCESDLLRLKNVFSQACGEHILVECAPSIAEAERKSSQITYDLILQDGNQKHPGLLNRNLTDAVPLADLRDQSNPPALQMALQNATCKDVKCAGPCLALSLLGAIEAYQRERQSESTEELLRKLRRTVEQSPDLVMITNDAGVLEYVNPAFEQVTGYDQTEVVGQPLGILKSEQQAGELYEEMWNTVLSGKVFHGVVMNRKKNGETFILEKSITPLRNRQGAITHFISTGRDITGQRQLEQQLQQAQKMDAIGKLAGGVAHDFNNLLMIISANAELTLDALSQQDSSRSRIVEIMNASRRAADLTRQLLAFSRRQVQSLRILDLNSVIAEVSRMLPRLIGEDIQFSFIPGDDLGVVKADPVQIEQIVMNLATNARDAMPQGGRFTIETSKFHVDDTNLMRHSIMPPGDYVSMIVSDSGMGIPRDQLEHVFEPFFTTKEAGKGTGLGLATVYGVVKQSGGFIWVYSEIGLGTTFKIYLPRTVQKNEIIARAVLTETPRGSETVLLVEDEADVRELTREFLTRSGYTVIEAGNGEDGLRASRDYPGRIDLLITDVVMPKMSGPALAASLAAERPSMKVLFVSGYAENTVLRHGSIDVTARFLAKPFDLTSLARKVRQVLEEPLARATNA
jgi:PAS domain S-box-containing protein